MRLGAFVTLARPITRDEFDRVSAKRYRGEYHINVDDESPSCPRRCKEVCPRYRGASKYCRGWNMRGVGHWRDACRFAHPAELSPTHGAERELRFADVAAGSAMYDQIGSEFLGAPFPDAGHGGGAPRIVRVREVVNPRLEALYNERKAYLERTYDGTVVEQELWHGTHTAAVGHLLAHGLQPPSDTCAADSCPRSGGKGCTSLCGSRCEHCTEPHKWGMCHMYGLGVYLADMAGKPQPFLSVWITFSFPIYSLSRSCDRRPMLPQSRSAGAFPFARPWRHECPVRKHSPPARYGVGTHASCLPPPDLSAL